VTTGTMRVTRQALETIRYLASVTGQKHQDVVDSAIEAYRRQVFLKQSNEAFANLRTNEEAWTQEASERAAWDSTLRDG